MKIGELKSIVAVQDAGFKVTSAADSTHTSQPGISRHVRNVENELGVQLFERHKNRLTGLTSAGKTIVPMISNFLLQLDTIRNVALEFQSGYRGKVTVATSHTHARYLLPPIIRSFIQNNPFVELSLRQGHSEQITEWLHNGEADISVLSSPGKYDPSLSFRKIGEMHRVILTSVDHPLLSASKVCLEEVARYPIITYSPEYAAHTQIMSAFEAFGLQPSVCLSAGDTDTIKTYVKFGMGVGIVASIAFDPELDSDLRAMDANTLFPPARIFLGTNINSTLSTHSQRLVQLIEDNLSKHVTG